jgi:paraquat-inducible protein A
MDLKSNIACQNCDIIHELIPVKINEVARCSRCGNTLYVKKLTFVDRSLALTLGAFIMYFPANFYPILTLSVIGNTKANSLFTGVKELFNGGYYFVSILVFLTSIFLPLISITSLLYTMISFKFNIKLPYVSKIFRIHEQINKWVMLEVYMLGILVALTKLSSIAKVSFGTGLFCYIALLLLIIISSISYDSFVIWKKMEQWGK